MRLVVRDHSLEVRWWNRTSVEAPTIVLLHEGLGSVSAWRTFPQALANHTGFQVLAYSRLGHGASDPPLSPRTVRFMHEEAIDELPAVLDAVGVAHPILLGHSDGASIALIFAGEYTSRVRALILEAPHVFVEDISIQSIARMKTLYATTDLRERLARHHGANVDTAFRGWNDVWLDPAFRDWNLEEYLPRITCPVLVLQGEGRRVRDRATGGGGSHAGGRTGRNGDSARLRSCATQRSAGARAGCYLGTCARAFALIG